MLISGHNAHLWFWVTYPNFNARSVLLPDTHTLWTINNNKIGTKPQKTFLGGIKGCISISEDRLWGSPSFLEGTYDKLRLRRRTQVCWSMTSPYGDVNECVGLCLLGSFAQCIWAHICPWVWPLCLHLPCRIYTALPSPPLASKHPDRWCSHFYIFVTPDIGGHTVWPILGSQNLLEIEEGKLIFDHWSLGPYAH